MQLTPDLGNYFSATAQIIPVLLLVLTVEDRVLRAAIPAPTTVTGVSVLLPVVKRRLTLLGRAIKAAMVGEIFALIGLAFCPTETWLRISIVAIVGASVGFLLLAVAALLRLVLRAEAHSRYGTGSKQS
jgi:hypothetical protein